MSGIDTRSSEHTMLERLEPEDSDIFCWRLDQLLQAGYAEHRARELAGNGDVDLHRACDLLARGCPEETAFAILA
jgi:hypothetical protein